jgi:hypothetical protein
VGLGACIVPFPKYWFELEVVRDEVCVRSLVGWTESTVRLRDDKSVYVRCCIQTRGPVGSLADLGSVYINHTGATF